MTRRAGEGEHLANLTSTSLAALRAYLDGQANYRRGRWEAAGSAFNTALDADTTFGLAALGVIEASRWSAHTRDVDRGNRIAWRLCDSFTTRDRALLVVLLGPRYPKAQTMGERGTAAELYRDLAPDSPDAWYQVGDWNFHYGLGAGVEDAARRAEQAFSRALALDSSFTPALEHLPILYEATGDSAKLRRAIVALRASAATPYDRSQAELVDWILQGNLGHPAKSAAALDNANPGQVAREANHMLGAIFWDWDSVGVGSFARTLEMRGCAEATGDPRGRIRAVSDLSAAAEYHAWRGDATSLAQAADALPAIAFDADSGGYTGVRDRYRLVLDVQLAAMTHRPDARALLTRLDSVLKADPQGVLGGLGNLVAARGWEAVGDVPRAVAAIRRTESLNAPGTYYTAQLLDEGRIATLAGDRDLASRSYRRYLVLRRDADPALQPQVETVRKELQRLEAQASRSR